MRGIKGWLCCGPVDSEGPQAEAHTPNKLLGVPGAKKLAVGHTTRALVHTGSSLCSDSDEALRASAVPGQDPMAQVTALLRSLTALHGSPLEQLQGACLLLADSLDVWASVSMLVENDTMSICLASAGDVQGAGPRIGVPQGLCPSFSGKPEAATSVEHILQLQEGLAGTAQDANLPRDWAEHRGSGYKYFAAVPVLRTGKVQGVLGVAARLHHAPLWHNNSVLGMLSAVAAWLSPLFSMPQLLQLPEVMARVMTADDVEQLVQLLASGLQEHLKQMLRVKVHPRVALLAGSSAVVYEQQNTARDSSHSPRAPTPASAPGDVVWADSPSGPMPASNLEVQAKLKVIRKSLAVSSLQDFKTLATAISANDDARDAFARESLTLGLAGSNLSSSQTLMPWLLGNSPPGSSVLHISPPMQLSPGSIPPASARLAHMLMRSGTGLNGSQGGRASGSELPETERCRSYMLPATAPLAPLYVRSTSDAQLLHPSLTNQLPDQQAVMEDVLLRLVHEGASDQEHHMVAHTLASLERTLLGTVLAQTGPDRGTWVSDLTTYMQQPNRPGKDIVLSPSSPALASLTLAAMPVSVVAGRRACHQPSQSSLVDLPGASAGAAALRAADDSVHGQSSGCHAGLNLLAVYITCPTTLSGLQLQTILNELQLVLRLLSAPLTEYLLGPLASSRNALLSSMLDEYEAAISGSITLTRKGTKTCTSLGPLAKKSNPGGFPFALPGIRSGGSFSNKTLAHMNSGEISPKSSQIHRARSMTFYSKEPIKPQVAPLVAGLQDRLRGLLAERDHSGCYNTHADLRSIRAQALIAHGGFGSVYQGLWQGLQVAIKVVPQRADLTDSMREAVELAVMTCVSHPHILGVQNYWTDVLVQSSPPAPGERRPNGLLRLATGSDLAGSSSSGASKDPRPLHTARSGSVAQAQLGGGCGSPLQPGTRAQISNPGTSNPEAAGFKRSMVIVMELCDQGSLDDAIQRGAFRLHSPTTRTTRVNLLAVLTTLLEIAMALRHLHSMQLVHCDLKPGNVLLKSSMSDIRQFTTKLCDFGLVKIRQEATDLTEVIRRSTFTGTVTHSPPEMLRGDPNPAFSYDVYAFGILMWEMVSSMPVYAGLSDRQVAQQVVYNNLRPEFNRGFDPQFKELAQRCWAPEPADRPTSEQLVHQIGAMLMELRDRATLAAAESAAAKHAAASSFSLAAAPDHMPGSFKRA